MSETEMNPVQKGADEVFCTSCGAIIKQAAEICPKCGVRQKPVPIGGTSGEKRKVTAGLLALFLGGYGGHWFYLRKPGKAFLYIGIALFLVFISMLDSSFGFLPFIMSIVALIDSIRIFSSSDEKFQEKFVK